MDWATREAERIAYQRPLSDGCGRYRYSKVSQRYPSGHTEGYPDTFRQMFGQAYQRIRGKMDGQPRFATLEDGRRGTVLIDAIVHSAMTGTWTSV